MKNQLRILLVDDDKVDRLAVRQTLGRVRQDFLIDEATDIASGIAAMRRSEYDCVIVDYKLPDGDGVSLIEEANHWNDSTTPFVVLTGKGAPDIDLAVMEAGAADYLEKDGLSANLLDRAIRYAIQNMRLVKRLKNANEKLKELDRLKSDFLSTASHELRTPLAIIREYIALMRDGITGAIVNEQKECLDSALDNCDRLGDLINDILDLQKIESGRLGISRKKTDILSLIERCCGDFRPQYNTKKQKLQLELPKELSPALCDENAIAQVLVNLIGNAHKFVPIDGTVTVRACRDDDVVIIDVEDDGPGISPQEQRSIFDKFTQLSRFHGPGAKGTGLGLAIVKNIIELHDGNINLRSAPGKGSTFTFTIPVYREKLALHAFFKDRMKVAASRAKGLSLLLLRLGTEQDSRSSAQDSERIKILRKMEELASNLFGRDNDETAVIESEGLVIILIEAGRDGGQAMVHRIIRTIAEGFQDMPPIYYSTVTVVSEIDPDKWLATAKDRLVRVIPKSRYKQVLVVDDDEEVLQTVTSMLESAELELTIESTTDGYDTCIRFGKSEPDLVILDIVMPGYDGRRVLQQIKKNAHGMKAKVMVISGHPGELDGLAKFGADDYLAKPFNRKTIVTKVATLLHGSSEYVQKETAHLQES